MILIADSGSTKTDWCLVENAVIIQQVFTKGINPFYQNETEIKFEINQYLLPQLKHTNIDKVFWRFFNKVNDSVFGNKGMRDQKELSIEKFYCKK